MKKGTLILCLIFFTWNVYLVPISHAQEQGRGRATIKDEVQQVWKGQYSVEDLRKWRKRLKKLSSMNKWGGVSICHNAIGVIHYYEGNFDEALKHLNQSLGISRENGFEKMVARNLHWIGVVQRKRGLHEEAFKNFNESMEIAKSKELTGMVGKNLRQMGLLLMAKGRNRESMDYLKRSLKLAEEKQNDGLQMSCLHNIGLIYRNQGNYEKAKDYFTRSLEVSQKRGDRRWTVSNYNGLGDVCFQQRDYQCALKHYQKSLSVSQDLNDRMGLAKAYNKMGKIYLRMRDPTTALHYFEKSHMLAKEMGVKALVASTSQNIAKSYGRMKRWEEALEKTDEAITILREIDIPAALQDSYHTRGIFLERRGDISGAEQSYRESVRILENLREDVAGGEEEMLAFVEMRGRVYQRLIALLLKQGKAAEALQYLERSRLQKLRDQFDQLRPHLNDEEEEKARKKEKKMREQIEQARVQLAEEKSKSKKKQDVEKIAQLENKLSVRRQEYIEYINDLREKFPELASLLAIQPDALIDLQGLLPPSIAIVQYLILDEMLYIFVVTNELLSHREVKVSQSDLEGKIDYLRSLLVNPQIPLNLGPLEAKTLRPKGEGRSDLYDMFIDPFLKASGELHDLLIKPVREELSRFEVLGIIPNGRLHLLPFQALGETNPQGEFRFLLEDKSIFYLNSQSILKFAQRRTKGIGGKGNLIAFGNPDNSLRHAEEEIDLIKEIYSKAKTYVRRDASEDKVKTELAGFNVLHLATHGKMKGNIKESFILLAPSSDGKEDGRLFIREIWGLQLVGYQLVTLSACETAMGKGASGDIMVSLETAFLRAGTPTIVASLWEVDDQATGILMKTFYHNLTRRGKAEALRRAQMALMKDPRYVYPYYWAPFILVGDWR
jgi:CHAT domain-containing protein